MTFLYDGFTSTHGGRCFAFHTSGEETPVRTYRLELELALLTQHHLSVQQAPLLCLRLLQGAQQAGPDQLEQLQHYRLQADDLQPLLQEQVRRAAAQASQKKAAFRRHRRPPHVTGVGWLAKQAKPERE